MSLPHSHDILRAGSWQEPAEDSVTLDYAARFLRRKRLLSDRGNAFLADLAHTESLDPGDAFALSDGRRIVVRAAAETLLEIRAGRTTLTRLAWHIGNRHTPCQIGPERLLICEDHVLETMLEGLGAALSHVTEPFLPEGGAYGHGRTMGHEHSHEHGHDHGHRHHHVHHHGAQHEGDPIGLHDHHSHDPHD